MIAMRELHRDRDESSWPTVDVARKVLVCLYEDLPHFWNFCCQVGLFHVAITTRQSGGGREPSVLAELEE